MKSKLVLWGSNAQDEKCLIAVSLRAADNKVDIWTFPESVATEDFYQRMMKEWRDGEGMELPDPKTHTERDLTLTGGLLPDDLKVERGDVVQRAQTEWHFVVLSSKLNDAYEAKLAELKERISKLEAFDQSTWDSLKEFWDKVQEQVRDRNLFRDHADRLRANANVLFAQMKELRTKLDQEFDRVSKEAHDKFFEGLAEVERKMESGARLPVLFDELKRLQSMFRESKVLSREHRNKVWEKLDATFKTVKERRFGGKPEGGGGDDGSQLQRTQRRYEGLLTAIEKMEQSIKRDHSDLDFQKHKIDTTDGQLEAQIRQAKLRMIEERISSKEEKLNEMMATKADLEKRLASMKDKEARRAAQEAAKVKIADEIKAREGSAPTAEEPLVAEPPKQQEESILGAVSAMVGESLDDVMDTVKAVASVLGDKIEEAIDELREEVHEATAPEAKQEDAPAAETPAEPVVAQQEEVAKTEEAAEPAAKPKRAPAAKKAKEAAAKEEEAPTAEEQ